MNNIALGRYLPLNSIIHNMDPRYKLMSMLILMVTIFLPSGYIGYVIIGAFVLLALLLAKLNFTMIFKAMKPMLFMLVFLTFVNALVLRTG